MANFSVETRVLLCNIFNFKTSIFYFRSCNRNCGILYVHNHIRIGLHVLHSKPCAKIGTHFEFPDHNAGADRSRFWNAANHDEMFSEKSLLLN